MARQEEGPGVCNVATQSFRPLKNDTWIGDLDRSDFNDDAVAPCRRVSGAESGRGCPHGERTDDRPPPTRRFMADTRSKFR